MKSWLVPMIAMLGCGGGGGAARIVGVVIGVQVREAAACSGCIPAELVPDEGASVPANLPLITWRPPGGPTPGSPESLQVTRDDAPGDPLPFSATAADSPARPREKFDGRSRPRAGG